MDGRWRTCHGRTQGSPKCTHSLQHCRRSLCCVSLTQPPHCSCTPRGNTLLSRSFHITTLAAAGQPHHTKEDPPGLTGGHDCSTHGDPSTPFACSRGPQNVLFPITVDRPSYTVVRAPPGCQHALRGGHIKWVKYAFNLPSDHPWLWLVSAAVDAGAVPGQQGSRYGSSAAAQPGLYKLPSAQ